MSDSSKSGQEIMQEMASLRARVAELEEEAARHRQMQESLRESEERFRSVFDNSLDAILITVPTGEVLSANPAAQSLLGMTEDEICRGGRAGFVVQDMALADALEERQRTGQWRGILTYRRKDGSTFPAEVSSKAFGTIKDPSRTITIFRDITERMRLEEDLRLSENKYRAIFDHVPIGIFRSSPEGRYVRANAQAARYLGYDSPEDLVETVTDIGTQVYGNPEDRKEITRFLREQGYVENFEAQFICKDGSMVWGSLNVKAVRDGNGEILYFEGTSQNIHARKLAEDALRESEERFRLFMDNSPTIAWIKDERGRYVYLSKNLEKRFALPVDWQGKTDEEIWPKGMAEAYTRNDRAALEANHPVEFSEETVKPDGSRNCWLTSKFPFRASGQLYIAGIALDITALKMAETELDRYRERLEALVKERTRELEEKTQVLEELNAATRVLLRHREEDRKELEGRFVANMKNLILPYAEKLKGTGLDDRQKSYLAIMETHLDEVLSPLIRTIQQHNLTPTEAQVASLIKDGRTTKEIAAILEVATSSIDTHRKSIRKKLGLNNAKVNLQSHLRSIEI